MTTSALAIRVRFRALTPSAALHAHARKRLQEALARHAAELGPVDLRVGDASGPRGGVDKWCRITLSGPRIGTTSLLERREDVYAAVDVCVERATTVVRRALGRLRRNRRR